MSFVSELKRRKVFQVAAVYLVVAWLIMQVVDVVNEPLRLPEWFATVAILIVAIGFPIALILSWAFDLTPEGVVRDQGTSVVVQSGGRRMEYVFTGLLVIAVGTLLYREFSPSDQVVEIVAEESQREVLPNSVAVLPFENLTVDPEYAFFAPGIHDTILNELAKISDLNVIARTSMERYADTDQTIQEIAEELNVETVMEGSVQYAEGRVLVTVQLIDPETYAHLWSDNYDREFAGIFEIQADIATRIAMALEAELLPAEQERIEKTLTNSPEAYAAYLKAIELWPGLTGSGVVLRIRAPSVAFLDEATTFDPGFALAYAHKAKMLGSSDARENIERALELDPDLGFGYLVLAAQLMGAGEVAEAQEAFERALQLSPNNPEVLTEYAQFKWMIGQAEDVDSLATRALQLDPNNWGAHYSIGELHRWAGDHAAAADAYRSSADLNPTNQAIYIALALEEAALGNFSEAQEQTRISEELNTRARGYGSARLAHAYSRAGLSADANRLFDAYQRELPAFLETSGPLLENLAAAYAFLAVGDERQALEALESIAESENIGLVPRVYELGVNAYNDPILDQPEFVAVRSRLGFRE